MKVALVGGKSLLDIVFLSCLATEMSNIDLHCFSDSGEVSFGSRVLKVKPIELLDVSKFDAVLNFSDEYPFVLRLIQEYNELAKNKVKYFNTDFGKLSFSYIDEDLSDLILLPAFGVEPICRALQVLEVVESINIVMNQPIAELGKVAMHRFHREIKESGFRIVKHGDDQEAALAFNISFPCLEMNCESNVVGFYDSAEEKLVKEQIKTLFNVSSIMVNQARVPVNKGASVVLGVKLGNKLSESSIKKKFQEAGFLYSRYALSTLLVENDSEIYVTNLKMDGKYCSMILAFDSIQRYVSNCIGLLSTLSSQLDTFIKN